MCFSVSTKTIRDSSLGGAVYAVAGYLDDPADQLLVFIGFGVHFSKGNELVSYILYPGFEPCLFLRIIQRAGGDEKAIVFGQFPV